MDPTQVLIVGNAIAGAAAAITEQAFSATGEVLKKIHSDQKPSAAQQMTANISAFANELNEQVKRLAESVEAIAQRAEQPAFVVQLQSALVSASQTDSQDIHVLLAGLVSQRLRVEADTTAAHACHRACQVVPDLTSAQLKMLGFLYTLEHMRFGMPKDIADLPANDKRLQDFALAWAQSMLNPFADLTCTDLDRMNLYAVGCCLPSMQWATTTESVLENILARLTGRVLVYPYFKSTKLGVCLEEALRPGKMILTSVGSLLGMFVADQLANRPTDLLFWQQTLFLPLLHNDNDDA